MPVYWSYPDRPFRILGEIEASYHKSGLVGIMASSSVWDEIVEKARAVGANAIWVVDKREKVVGWASGANAQYSGWGASASGWSYPILRGGYSILAIRVQ
ncbi:hypothetical protein [Candidatus Methylacidithermus pantelleriae]|uniref:Uncharacterized protein n=1 Tax=Candidatus Methylacidithermus pantelleriae TaxID=2744239 RepID=A0A8J2FMX2_9BACT|nr:hypothetical protein [Candidatus Methylacidithermus pantelleriae]CAF0688806.1 hypothetical protein MPNT_10013 [Candidatus Methylacidithermus pantelleriae]